MKTISISKSSLAEVNAAVAEYVAGKLVYWDISNGLGNARLGHNSSGPYVPIADYATDANAVFPLLEPYSEIYIARTGWSEWEVTLYDDRSSWSINKSLPLAACYALLRAKGVPVTD